NESKVIEDIVAHVTSLLDSTDLFVAEHPVGVNSRVQDLIQLINNHKSDDALVIAIWGMAGIGKTTIAKALYNQLSRNFDVRKFVPNIKGRLNDIIWHLHKDLLSVHGISVKTSLMRDSHCISKVFLVIDNVRTDLELLEILSLTRNIREFFGPGTIVIITTRVNTDPFSHIKFNNIYRVKEMDYNECVELFSWSAFKKPTPERSFSGLINYAIEFSDGLPLALVAIGSALSEKNIEEWENVLDRIKTVPLQDVWQILKKCINSVRYKEKKMFVELAYLGYLFIGMDRNDISQLLQEAGHDEARRAIKVLEEHSLVWFEEDKLCMHRLLQHIGTEMYMKESSIEPQQMPHDVFLSFRGSDSRSKFISHLHSSLENADPSEVRNQTGAFGQAFDDLIKGYPHKIKGKEQSWRKALREVGCLAGMKVKKYIVEHVTHMLDMKELFVANHPVGVESRVEEVIKLLRNQQQETPLLLGIWGMGGSGKTTIAKAQRLSAVYKTTKIKIDNTDSGKSILEKRLGQKKILLVLDDVDKLEQIYSLAASRKWFCPGSTIIITTRDEHLLRCLKIDKLYGIKVLNEKESMELFSWHAFKEPSPKKEFALLANEVVSYCERLPLALEVIGSHLFTREVYEWKDVLKKLKTIPNNDVHKKLKISFDGLSDDRDREIFLDVAFFFIGMDKNDVVDILNGCGHSAEIGINILMERCLITVDTKRKLGMHGLL
ncbi:hypothetical protein PIB30_092134, partial [Stylosanthes scabra]|nr:hypothetical protein [Stylosanthes scabra]